MKKLLVALLMFAGLVTLVPTAEAGRRDRDRYDRHDRYDRYDKRHYRHYDHGRRYYRSHQYYRPVRRVYVPDYHCYTQPYYSTYRRPSFSISFSR